MIGAFGVKGTNNELLETAVSFKARAAVANWTIKISASIATTLRSSHPNTPQRHAKPLC
jgi:hypothetical protein